MSVLEDSIPGGFGRPFCALGREERDFERIHDSAEPAPHLGNFDPQFDGA